MLNDEPSVAVLACPGAAQYALVNRLAARHRVVAVVLEDRKRVLARTLLKRILKQGPWTVLNQLTFKVVDVLVFQPKASVVAREVLLAETMFSESLLPEAIVVRTASVNSSETVKSLAMAKPDVVVVSGTSILGRPLLDALRGTLIINIHCGVTPRYRGSHGAFWAAVNRDWENLGTTIHLIDEGLDTGAILAQKTIKANPEDNPRTLALKQNAAGIELALQVIHEFKSGTVKSFARDDLDSRFYSSPTLQSYLEFRAALKDLG